MIDLLEFIGTMVIILWFALCTTGIILIISPEIRKEFLKDWKGQ
jgi:hypothetical protein